MRCKYNWLLLFCHLFNTCCPVKFTIGDTIIFFKPKQF